MERSVPIIGIPAARDTKSDANYNYQRVGEPYLRAIEDAGGCGLIIPVTENRAMIRRICSFLDGVLLPGGGDVSPRLYGKKPSIALGVDELTDRFELELCRLSLDADKPLLAICRGIQILNVAMGGTLIQDIPTELNTPVTHRQAESRDTCVHGIQVESDSQIAKILGQTEFDVNSFHHQAIDRPGKGLRVVARSTEDGIVEGVEGEEHRFAMGVQFHPEEICKSVRPTAELFRALVLASAETAARENVSD